MNLINSISNSALNLCSQFQRFSPTILHLSQQNIRIVKIAGGLALIGGGSGLICHSRLLAQRATNDKEKADQEPIRWRTAAIGLAATCLGVCSVASGVMEYLYSISCDERLVIAKSNLLKCPEARDLWDSLEREDLFTVTCTKEELPFDAVTYMTREIAFSSNHDQTLTESTLLFELNNLRNAKAFTFLMVDNMCNFAKDKYASAMEQLVFNTAEKAYNITKKCVDQNIWPLEWNYYKDLFTGKITRDEYFQIQEQIGHTDMYRRQWEKFCNSTNEP